MTTSTIGHIVFTAQAYMESKNISGWLLYDYRGMNPIFYEVLGHIPHITRPCWLWIPAKGNPKLLASFVDQGRFANLNLHTTLFSNRTDMTFHLSEMLYGARQIAMEYSPNNQLPRVSRVDAGTIELVRSIGVKIISSGDTLQYATQRWNNSQLETHLSAASKLKKIVMGSFNMIGESLHSNLTEYEVAEFIRQRFIAENLELNDGPVVAVNEHSSDPHFEPTSKSSSTISVGDWVLIDLWSRIKGEDTMYADITWTAYIGVKVPDLQQRIFDIVIGARDASLAEIERRMESRDSIEGWEIDKVAREYIEKAGYGCHFKHRLGHSLGKEAHGNAVNLDGWETNDTRSLIPGIAVTIEPGIYLPGEFGVRSEINVYISENGPQLTTEPQQSVVLI